MIKDLLTPEKIEAIKKDPFYKDYFDYINQIIEENKDDPMPQIPYSAYRLFKVTGDRQQYETPYFIRRRVLMAYAMRYIFDRNPEDLAALQDAIWEICNEFTWALTAHLEHLPISNPEGQAVSVDLFAAETGASIAEIYSILKDEFEPRINERIKYELNRRIIESFITTRHNFEDGWNNWTGVCCGSVGLVVLYVAPERFNLFRDRLLSPLARYISTFGESGICEEGISYWNYGFSNYIYFAEMLKEHTQGRINILDTPRIETIATFGCNAFIRKNHTISYSDASHSFKYNLGLNHFLADTFEKAYPLDPSFASKQLSHFFKDAIRTLLWINPKYLDTSEAPLVISEDYEEKLCWYISKKAKYSFTAKGGNNEESHNHNDLGSFILLTDNGQQIIDFGAGYYNKNYFQIPLRYEENITACSRGHNVPIINGVIQQHGKSFVATSSVHENNRFVLDLSKAYPECGMSGYTREFNLSEDTVKICDKISFTADKNTVNEHFISYVKPEVHGNNVTIGEVTLTCSENGKINILEEKARPSTFREHLQNYSTVYITEVIFDCGKELSEEFIIKIN